MKPSKEKTGIRQEEPVKGRRRAGLVGDSVKKFHAFVIFISVFSFVLLFFFLRRNLMNMDESVNVMALFLYLDQINTLFPTVHLTEHG